MTLSTLAGAPQAAAARAPDATAIVEGDSETSFAQLNDLVESFARSLAAAGIRRGDRVAIVLPNSLGAVVAILGTMRAGAAIVPLNPTTKRERLRYVLTHVGASALVAGDEAADAAAVATEEDVTLLSDPLADDAGEAPLPPPPLETDLAAVLYTSGSTGEPKGVTLTHRNLAFVTDSIASYLELSEADRILCVLQLSFGYGLSQLLPCLRVGAALVLERAGAMPGTIVKALEDQRITGMAGVPTIFQVLTSLSGLAERPLPDLRFLTNAGASLPAATVAAVRQTFPGARLYLMYGLTECIRVTYLPPDQLEARPTSSGIPIPGTDAWVEGGGGGVAEVGEVGELLVRGPHVMRGYWDDPERTAERLSDGRWPWEPVMRTGDLFRRDEDGYLHWVGRTDDLIKSRGEKVYPREVEEVLHGIEGVREAAVIGVEDRLLGQAVHAHVSLVDGGAGDERALRRGCADALEDHKVPQRVLFHEELPRTPRGKLDRAALLERSTEGASGER